MNASTWKNKVFLVSAAIIVVFVVLGAIRPKQFDEVAGTLFGFTTVNFGWFYLLSVFLIILFLIILAISKYGKIRLGGENERPEFNFFTWVGMLFSAGFGAGLVFWGVAEPMSHFFTSPAADVQAQTEPGARLAMAYSFFHWGISQWSVFAMVGLVIGFLQFRKKQNGLVSTALEPVTGTKPAVKGSIDVLAVVATVMGLATSIGLGILQMNGGLNAVFNVPNAFWVQIILIAIMFVAYMLSSTTGLSRGIKYLSNLNLSLAIILSLFVFVTGPTVFILETFVLALGDYITNFVQYSLRLQPYQQGVWVQEWTIFYWAWAIAWSPFVGAFVARVSKGRTIREFIAGVMVIPPAIAMVWIAIFGGTALYKDLNENAGIAEAVNADLTLALFETFNQLPFSTITSLLAILLIFTFLVTSADSATFILASMTSRGSLNPSTPLKLVWGVLMALIAGILLFAGGLGALQTASLISALPFTVLLLLLIVAMYKLLKREPIPISKREIRRYKEIQAHLEKEEKNNQN